MSWLGSAAATIHGYVQIPSGLMAASIKENAPLSTLDTQDGVPAYYLQVKIRGRGATAFSQDLLVHQQRKQHPETLGEVLLHENIEAYCLFSGGDENGQYVSGQTSLVFWNKGEGREGSGPICWIDFWVLKGSAAVKTKGMV